MGPLLLWLILWSINQHQTSDSCCNLHQFGVVYDLSLPHLKRKEKSFLTILFFPCRLCSTLWAVYAEQLLSDGNPLTSTYGKVADRTMSLSFDYERFSKACLDNYTLASLFMMLVLGWSAFCTTFLLFGALLEKGKNRKYVVLFFALPVFGFLRLHVVQHQLYYNHVWTQICV